MIDLPSKAVIAVIHLPPLPGSSASRLTLSAILQQAETEASVLKKLGYDALIVENFGDAPFCAGVVEPHTTAMMTRCVAAVVAAGDLPVGVNMLRNDGLAGLAVAAAAGARFIRVNVLTGVYATDQGLIEGQAPAVLQYRKRICPEVAICADVHVKHAQPLNQPDIAIAAEETAGRGGADAIVVSGQTTGRSADLDEARLVKRAVPDHPVFVGSGATPGNVAACLDACDGVIVGSCLKKDGRAGNSLDPDRASTFIDAAKADA